MKQRAANVPGGSRDVAMMDCSSLLLLKAMSLVGQS
jgi:hypothetical protein